MYVPVIDVGALFSSTASEAAADEVARAIAQAIADVGFLCITGTGTVPITEQFFSAVWQFFLQTSEQEKMETHIDLHGYRGYQCLGEEVTNGMRDHHAAIDFYRETEPSEVDSKVFEDRRDAQQLRTFAFSPNKWPSNPPDFRSIAEAYVTQMIRIGETMMMCMAKSLGLPGDAFAPWMDKSYWCLRTMYYPPSDGSGHFGVGDHTDYGFLTLLVDDGPPNCLEVKMPNGEWTAITRPSGSIICNIGDMLSHASGGTYKATSHRVVSPIGKNRVSIPFFFEPNFDACITFPDGRNSVIYGDHLYAKISKNLELIAPQRE